MHDQFALFAKNSYLTVLPALSAWLDKLEAHAVSSGLSDAQLREARLATDMFPLPLQVHLACDQARDALLTISGEDAPRIVDERTSLDELRARIAETVAWLEGFPDSRLAGADERSITFPTDASHEFRFTGRTYLQTWGLPNFYFHVVTAYGILRNLGTPIGKEDYMSYVGPFINEV